MGCSSSNTIKENEKKNTNRKVLRSQTGSIIEKEISKPEDIKILPNALVVENKGSIGKNYKIIDKLGSGTFGKVYKVIHIPTQQKRAMKVVKKDTVNYQDDDKL